MPILLEIKPFPPHPIELPMDDKRRVALHSLLGGLIFTQWYRSSEARQQIAMIEGIRKHFNDHKTKSFSEALNAVNDGVTEALKSGGPNSRHKAMGLGAQLSVSCTILNAALAHKPQEPTVGF